VDKSGESGSHESGIRKIESGKQERRKGAELLIQDKKIELGGQERI
jgi:hypothetical protein